MIGLLLKEKTKDLHDLVEDKLQSGKIMDKSFTRSNYQQLLEYNYSFLLHFEDAVFEKISAENAKKLNLEKRRKLPFLLKDLRDLKFQLPERTVIKTEAEAFGILYVMEGATLGGNVIAKNLAKNPEFADVSFNFFGCYGAETGILWKNFREVLESEYQDSNAEDILSGAKRAYQFLLDL